MKRTAAMKRAILHHYRRARRHQMETYRNSGLYIEGVDQRQFVGGPAAYGCHALAAYNDARRTIHFRQSHGIPA